MIESYANSLTFFVGVFKKTYAHVKHVYCYQRKYLTRLKEFVYLLTNTNTKNVIFTMLIHCKVARILYLSFRICLFVVILYLKSFPQKDKPRKVFYSPKRAVLLHLQIVWANVFSTFKAWGCFLLTL